MHSITPGTYDCLFLADTCEDILDTDHSAWAQAPRSAPFVDLKSKTPLTNQTTVGILYDRDALHFSFQIDDSRLRHGSSAAGDSPEKSKRKEPRIELYLDPQREAGEMFYIACTIYGNIWAGHLGAGNDPEMTSKPIDPVGVVCETTLTASGWRIRMTVPFRLLGDVHPTPGARWRANVIRVDFDEGTPRLHCWPQSVGASLWDAWGMGFLHFTNRNIAGAARNASVALPGNGPSPTTPSMDTSSGETKFRGILMCLPVIAAHRQEYVEQFIDFLAAQGINYLILYGDNTVRFRGHEAFAAPGAISAETLSALSAYAKQRGVTILPSQPSFGHCPGMLGHENYRHLSEDSTNYQLCPSNPGTYELLDDLYGQWIAATDSPWLHVNCDESGLLGLCETCRDMRAKIGPDGIYLEHLLRLHELVTRHGKRMVIWGDILGRLPTVAERLPRDIIIMDWLYGVQDRYPSLDYFCGLGYEVVVTGNWHRTDNIRNLIAYAQDLPVQGIMNSFWDNDTPLEAFYYDCIHTARSGKAWAPQAPAALAHAVAHDVFGTDSHAVREALEIMSERQQALEDEPRLRHKVLNQLCDGLAGGTSAPGFARMVQDWLLLERDLLALQYGNGTADVALKQRAHAFGARRFADGWEENGFGRRLKKLGLL